MNTVPNSMPGIIPNDGDHVVIVGAGLAGLFTALKLAPRGATVVAACPLGTGASSVWAQGGLAAAVADGDTPERHAADTIAVGGGIVEPAVAELLAREAPERIEDLLRFGVPFDRDLEGKLRLSREAAHSERRILRVSGDRAGQVIMEALIGAARNAPSIRILEGFEAKELALDASGCVAGLYLQDAGPDASGELRLLPTRAVVLATGGIGSLYAITTNPQISRGEGLGLAARAGAIIADPEFVQFHPTALDTGREPAPLATEALRGDGAVLADRSGRRFMPQVHDDADLAPRDIVARAVHRERIAGRGAFLDCRETIGPRFEQDFPTVYGLCKDAGIDPMREPIPVAPAAHYHMGGILTDAHGRSSIDGLWACGEVASTGLHGANRLASNSLIEAVVFGERIARDISECMASPAAVPVPEGAPRRELQELSPLKRQALVRALRQAMDRHAGVERDGNGLHALLAEIDRIRSEAVDDIGLANMLAACTLIAVSALTRRESRGAHFRTDYPAAADMGHRSYWTLDEALRAADRALHDRPAEIAAHARQAAS